LQVTNNKRDKELFLFAGANGSGKSTLVNDFIEQGMCPSYYICPDNNLDKRYKENKGVYIEAMKKAEAQRYNAIAEGRSFSFESVFSTSEKLEFLKYAKSKDYFITAIYIVTKDPQINIDRIRSRVLSGGHNVPTDKVISRYYKSIKLMAQCLEVANTFILIDNSGDKPIRLLDFNEKLITFFVERNKLEWLKEYLPKIIQ
jgi:predicted ABC-type ATPase